MCLCRSFELVHTYCYRIKNPDTCKNTPHGYKWGLTTLNKICLSYALNLVNNDHTQGTTFHGLLVPVAHSIAIVASHWHAAPVVNRESINLCSHSVLECQTYELNSVFPTETVLHQCSHPPNNGALPSAR